MPKLDLGKVRGDVGPQGPPGPTGPAGPKGTGIDITKLEGSADNFKENGYKWTSNISGGIPVQANSKFGILSHVTHKDDAFASDGGVQTFYNTYSDSPGYNGKIFVRSHQDGIWQDQGNWAEIMTNKDVFKRTDWKGVDTQVDPDPNHVKERGYLQFPFQINGHNIVLEWLTVDTAKYDRAEIPLEHLSRIYNVQLTQHDKSSSGQDDTFFNMSVAVRSNNNIVLNVSEKYKGHVFVLVVGISKPL